MRLVHPAASVGHVWLLLSLACGAAAAAPSSGSCKRLTDPDSTFWTSIVPANLGVTAGLPAVPLDAMFGSLDSTYPWASLCMASLDVRAISRRVLQSQRAWQCLQQLSTAPGPASDGVTDDAFFTSYFCPMYQQTLVPCVSDVILSTLTDVLTSNNNPCCSDLRQAYVQAYNASPEQLAISLLKRVGNVLCSLKTTTNSSGVKYKQSCGSVWATALLNSDNDVDRVIHGLLQLPSADGCNAVTGQSFQITNGSTIAALTKPRIDVCYQPMDQLIQYIKQWPTMQTVLYSNAGTQVKLVDLFAASTCVNGGPVLQLMLSKGGSVPSILSAIDDALSFLDSLSERRNSSWARTRTGPRSSHRRGSGSRTRDSANFVASALGSRSNGEAYNSSGTSTATDTFNTIIEPHMDDMKQFCMHVANELECNYQDKLELAFADPDSIPVIPETVIPTTDPGQSPTTPVSSPPPLNTTNTTTKTANSAPARASPFVIITATSIALAVLQW